MKRFAPLALVLLLTALAAPARAEHIESVLGPGEPTREFPADFNLPVDQQASSTLSDAFYRWTQPYVGGWGGDLKPQDDACPGGGRRPVVFVHGTTEDASFWRASESGDGSIVNVRQRFLKAGYCEEDLWAISYTGAKGYFTYNDFNTEEVFAFIEGVRKYTDSGNVDVVAHSLGVTVVRKAAFLHPVLYRHIANLVAIAGANHGTTTCREVGENHGSHVCEEIEPGSAWLDELNGEDETPKGPRYLTILNGAAGDHFYEGPDALSPELDGACNHLMPLLAHNSLARDSEAVDVFLPFLRDGTLPPCSPFTYEPSPFD